VHQGFDFFNLKVIYHNLFVALREESFHDTHEEIYLVHGKTTENSLKNFMA
jgi:hypothetical protein